MANGRLPNESKHGPRESGGQLRRSAKRKRSGVIDEQFRLALEATPAAMIMVDGTGHLVFINALAETLFGYSRNELVGRPIETLVPERYRPNHPGLRNTFLVDPSPRAMGAGRELYALRKDGREIPVEIGLNPFKTEQGNYVLASIVDITERKRSEE